MTVPMTTARAKWVAVDGVISIGMKLRSSRVMFTFFS
jgi:hypothetical protein